MKGQLSSLGVSLAVKHKWSGGSFLAVCMNCGCVREKKRTVEIHPGRYLYAIEYTLKGVTYFTAPDCTPQN